MRWFWCLKRAAVVIHLRSSSSTPHIPQDAVPGKDFGQVWRDRLRLVQLENNGWKVYSCDLGHDESLGEMDRHLQSNFDHHRFPEAFMKRWPEGLKLRLASMMDEKTQCLHIHLLGLYTWCFSQPLSLSLSSHALPDSQSLHPSLPLSPIGDF
jgi:hypothetical protein